MHHSKVLMSFQANILLLICAMYLKKKKDNKRFYCLYLAIKGNFTLSLGDYIL